MSRRRDRHIIIRIFNGLSAYEWKDIISLDLGLCYTYYNFFNETREFHVTSARFNSFMVILFPPYSAIYFIFHSFWSSVATQRLCNVSRLSWHTYASKGWHTKGSNDINPSIIDCDLSERVWSFFNNKRKRGLYSKRSWLQSHGNLFKTYYPAPELSRNLISQFKLKRRSLVRTKEFHPLNFLLVVNYTNT